jgi:hypothetical protein
MKLYAELDVSLTTTAIGVRGWTTHSSRRSQRLGGVQSFARKRCFGPHPIASASRDQNEMLLIVGDRAKPLTDCALANAAAHSWLEAFLNFSHAPPATSYLPQAGHSMI